MQVFVLGINDNPLMPTHPAKARKLIKEKKAIIIGYRPFTIQLTYETTEYTQPITIGVDTGAKFIGIAVESEGKILAKGEIELRADISKLLTKRKLLRRARRSRNLRYRESRFNNRFKPKGYLPPSIKSRINNTIMWIEKFKDLIPTPKLIVEIDKFDVQKIKNEEIYSKEYQRGEAYDFYNVRYYVFARDNYKCQVCKGKSKDKILQTHHIITEINGGSNMADNLATICTKCHKRYHTGKIKHEFKKPKQYKETAFINILRGHITNRLDCRLTYGYITAVDRRILDLDKSHINDAIAITGVEKIVKDSKHSFIIKQFRKKKRSLHESNIRKRKSVNRTQVRNERNRKFSKGFYRGDAIIVNNIFGYIYGLNKDGYAYVKDINKDNIIMPHQKTPVINPKYLKFINHNNNWFYKVLGW